MLGRRAEDAGLAHAAAETLRRYAHLITDEAFAELLRQVDEVSADGIRGAPEWAHARQPPVLAPPL
eukprot:scaffold22147_cov120-Isochrysis_galbana.AAC.1